MYTQDFLPIKLSPNTCSTSINFSLANAKSGMNVNNIEKPFEGSLAFYKLKIMILKVNFHLDCILTADWYC